MRGVRAIILQHAWDEPSQVVIAYEGKNTITGYSSPIERRPEWQTQDQFWASKEAVAGFKEAFSNYALALEGEPQEVVC
jgi:hypothetical protein